MTDIKITTASGIALLETALTMLLLLPLTLGVIATCDIARARYLLDENLKRNVHDSGVKSEVMDHELGNAISFNQHAIDAYLTELADTIELQLTAEVSEELTYGDYRIEVAYARLGIDSKSGSYNGAIQMGAPIVRGSATIRAQSFESLFTEAAFADGVSRAAMPRINLDGTNAYLSEGVLVAVRGSVSLKNHFAGSILAPMGIPAEVETTQLIALRGAVE